jgi:nicotinamidase-related amidase
MARRVPFTLATRSVPRIAIRAENTALLVLDMQRYFADPEGGYNKVARDRGVEREYTDYYVHVSLIIPNIQSLIALARKHGMPVIYTQFAYLDPSDVSLLQKSLGITISCDDPEAEILPAVEPGKDDPVIVKTGLSAFSNPALEEELRARGIENLILTGVMTEFSVRATVYSALDLGFRPIIVSDGCAGITRETHGGVTSEMTFGMTKVRTTGEILRYAKELEFDDVVLI